MEMVLVVVSEAKIMDDLSFGKERIFTIDAVRRTGSFFGVGVAN